MMDIQGYTSLLVTHINGWFDCEDMLSQVDA